MTTYNVELSERLREVAALLESQEASPFRIAAWRHAADTVAALDVDLRDLVAARGLDGLIELPGIDRAIGGAVRELVTTGRLHLLDRLRGTTDPEELFRSIPGVGPRLAKLLHETLQVDTLEALEVAAHDGRLERIPGLGPRRIAALRASLAARLGRPHGEGPISAPTVDDEPPVDVLLSVDEEYRRRADRGELPLITPRRMNPEAKAWLPILHTQRGKTHFTALYSNTGRAHALGRTRDWVILYFSGPDHREHQRTIVTETHGALRGERVVRGREVECLRYFRDGSAADADGRSGTSARSFAPSLRHP